MMRKIIVDGKEYKWRCGRSYVVIRNEKTSWCIPAWEITGVTADIFERGRYKQTSDGMVKPSHVANWIKNNMN